MTPVLILVFAAHRERYVDLQMRPIRITVEIEHGSNLVSYDPVNLDNLLARLVLEDATDGQTMVTCADTEYLDIPVPLHALWRDPDGLPLYAATPFIPDGPSESDVVYWHKRPQEGAFTSSKSGTWSPRAAGNRYAERRIGTPVTVCDRWTAECVGNPEEIARLLSTVTSIGKRRGSGHGVVRSWQIAAIESFTLVLDGRLTRNIPEGARHLLGRHVPEGLPAPLGWTPPQWRPALFRPGWRIGTSVHDLETWVQASS